MASNIQISGGLLPRTDAARPSPFERLSGELRNQIYDLVFGDMESAVLQATSPDQPQLVPHSLVRTNRQLRSETLLLYQTIFDEFMRPDEPTTPINLTMNIENLGLASWTRLRKGMFRKTDLNFHVRFKVHMHSDRSDMEVRADICRWAGMIATNFDLWKKLQATYLFKAAQELGYVIGILSLIQRLRSKYQGSKAKAEVHVFLDALEHTIRSYGEEDDT